MFGSLLIASAAIATVPAPVEVSASRAAWIDVGYEELRAGDAEAAINHIRSNRAIEADDPAAMINLGAAHARLGKSDKARAYYLAAIASRVRYDVQLADGRWMDTRRAARLAIELQARGTTIALR
jgi:Tfp pilus assembly protein PilF